MPPRPLAAIQAGAARERRRPIAWAVRLASALQLGWGQLRDLFPLTTLGVGVALGSAALVGYFGFHRIDMILLVVGAVLGGVTLVAVLAVVGISAALRLFHSGSASQGWQTLECGFPARTGFGLPSYWFVPLVQIRWEWLELRANVAIVRQRGRLLERATPLARARLERARRRVVVSDAFGLARIAFVLGVSHKVRVLPACGALRQASIVRSLTAGDELPDAAGDPLGDRADLRRYAPGDPVRYVLWKVFARSRQAFVRIPERALNPGRHTLCYVVAGKGDEASAAAARVAVESGALGEHWVLGADGSDEEAGTRERALDMVASSAHVAAEDGAANLARFIERARLGPRPRILIFAPAEPGPWLERLRGVLRAHVGRISHIDVVIAVDGVAPLERRRWFERLALRAPNGGVGPLQPTRSEDLRQVISAVTAASGSVLLLDRVLGRVYGRAHQRAMGAA